MHTTCLPACDACDGSVRTKRGGPGGGGGGGIDARKRKALAAAAEDNDEGDGDDDSDATDDSAADAAESVFFKRSVFFKQESTPEYLVTKLNDYAAQGKLRSKREFELIAAVHASLSEINVLLLAYRPPLVSRAADWRQKRALFDVAFAGASPGVDIGKLIPFQAVRTRARARSATYAPPA